MASCSTAFDGVNISHFRVTQRQTPCTGGCCVAGLLAMRDSSQHLQVPTRSDNLQHRTDRTSLGAPMGGRSDALFFIFARPITRQYGAPIGRRLDHRRVRRRRIVGGRHRTRTGADGDQSRTFGRGAFRRQLALDRGVHADEERRGGGGRLRRAFRQQCRLEHRSQCAVGARRRAGAPACVCAGASAAGSGGHFGFRRRGAAHPGMAQRHGAALRAATDLPAVSEHHAHRGGGGRPGHHRDTARQAACPGRRDALPHHRARSASRCRWCRGRHRMHAARRQGADTTIEECDPGQRRLPGQP